MLQEQIKKLKERINELQATIDLQKDRLVNLQMNNVDPKNTDTSELIQDYIRQIEELNNKLAQAEGKILWLELIL